MSREKKFTPGPWEHKADTDYHIMAGGNSILCDMNYYPWAPENEHDWPLIAAAPELLDALEGLLVLCMSEPMEDSAVEFDAAEKALAKAYGETP